MLKYNKPAAVFLSLSIFALISCNIIFTTSLGKFAARKKISSSEFKPISKMLKEAKSKDILYDYYASRAFIENISMRSPIEIFSLADSEKDQILNIAIAGTTKLGEIFKVITSALNEDGSLNIESKKLRKELLKYFDTQIDIKAVGTVLADKEYLKAGALDSIVFGMCILLSNAANIVGYDITEESLNNGNSDNILDKVAKTNIEEIIYSYKMIYQRPDLEVMEFAGVKLKDLLPEINI